MAQKATTAASACASGESDCVPVADTEVEGAIVCEAVEELVGVVLEVASEQPVRRRATARVAPAPARLMFISLLEFSSDPLGGCCPLGVHYPANSVP
jgi:hypothetical protein